VDAAALAAKMVAMEAEIAQLRATAAQATAAAAEVVAMEAEMAQLRAAAVEVTACVVCADAPNAYACVPCGHKCLCAACSAALPQPQSCPMCRKVVASFMRICDAAFL